MASAPQFDADVRFANIPAHELGRMVRTGELSAEVLLDDFTLRIHAHNPSLNALVADQFKRSRHEARAIDAAVARGEDPGPLAGVPFTTKEMASVEGLPITAGSLGRTDAVSHRDSTFVERLRAAGALPVGVSNQSELGLWVESVNPVYGRTNNPHDLSRTCGGSSGGEGALVGAGLNGFGIGSDMGGSIRVPAQFCGVFGHKPTGNFVPCTGHYPLDYSAYRTAAPPSTRYVSVGPMSRHATDLLPILDVISGACPGDVDAIDPDLGEIEDVAGKRVYYLEDPAMRFVSSPAASQRGAVTRAIDVLRERGADVRPWDGPSLKHSFQIFTCGLQEIGIDGVGLEHLLGKDGKVGLLRELPRILRGRNNHTGASLMVVFGERYVGPTKRGRRKMVEAGRQLAIDLDSHLGDDGVLILPTSPRPAPKHGRTLLRPFDIAYTGVFNITENPVTAAPTGFVGGLPTGVQIVGRRGNDHLPISVAVAMEAGGLGWLAPRGRR